VKLKIRVFVKILILEKRKQDMLLLTLNIRI